MNKEWAYSVEAYLSICRSVGLHCHSLLHHPSYSKSPEVNCVTTWRKTSWCKEGVREEHVMSRLPTLLPMSKIGLDQSVPQLPFDQLICKIYLDPKMCLNCSRDQVIEFNTSYIWDSIRIDEISFVYSNVYFFMTYNHSVY